MFKFLHAADLHLDSPLKGLERYEGAPVDEIRNATRRAVEQLVQTAIDEEVSFVLIAGDVYDGNWPDYNTGLYFVSQVTRLREAGIPLFLIAGNHDAANKMTRSLKLPDNVRFFSDDAAETAILDECDVAIHGQSFASQAVYEDLSAGYPTVRSGMFNIGLLHTCASGYDSHERYAPCSVEGLRVKGYDYWALGHIHSREVLCRDPYIGFSGNLQGRHVRETGPKGCFLVTVEDDRSVDLQFQPLDVLRWERVRVDVSEARTTDDALHQVACRFEECRDEAGGRPLAIRVELTGAAPVHHDLLSDRQHWTAQVRSDAIEASNGGIWVEKVRILTTPERALDEESLQDGPIGELMAVIEELRKSPEQMRRLGIDFTDIERKLPPPLRKSIRFDDPDWLGALLAEAEPRLRHQLLRRPAR